MSHEPMYIWDDDVTQPDRPTDDLPRTVPGYAPERLGRPVEPRSEGHEERLFQRICAAMRDADGTWARRFGLALTWSVHDGPDSSPWSDDHDEQETYALRMVTVHAVEVSDEDGPWRAPAVELRQESLWLMRHHLEAIEVQRPRLYGGSAYVLLSDPPTGASDHAPLQAVEITIVHAPLAGRPAGDADGFWSSTHLLRARELAQPLVLAMGCRPPALPG